MKYTEGECTCWIKSEINPLPPIIGENRAFSIVKCPLCKAAPDMYEALKEIGLNIAVNYDDDVKPIFLIDKAYLDRVQTIVAKAEGKTDD